MKILFLFLIISCGKQEKTSYPKEDNTKNKILVHKELHLDKDSDGDLILDSQENGDSKYIAQVPTVKSKNFLNKQLRNILLENFIQTRNQNFPQYNLNFYPTLTSPGAASQITLNFPYGFQDFDKARIRSLEGSSTHIPHDWKSTGDDIFLSFKTKAQFITFENFHFEYERVGTTLKQFFESVKSNCYELIVSTPLSTSVHYVSAQLNLREALQTLKYEAQYSKGDYLTSIIMNEGDFTEEYGTWSGMNFHPFGSQYLQPGSSFTLAYFNKAELSITNSKNLKAKIFKISPSKQSQLSLPHFVSGSRIELRFSKIVNKWSRTNRKFKIEKQIMDKKTISAFKIRINNRLFPLMNLSVERKKLKEGVVEIYLEAGLKKVQLVAPKLKNKTLSNHISRLTENGKTEIKYLKVPYLKQLQINMKSRPNLNL